MAIRRFPLVFVLLLSAALSLAEIRYTVEPQTDKNRILVHMEFEAKAGNLELQMPNWSPGAYFLNVPARSVQDFVFKGPGGAMITTEKPNDNTWKASLVSAGKVMAQYTVPCNLTAGAMHYSGPPTYMYPVGRKEEACKLTLNVPEGWKIAVGLDGSGKVYTAPDYDVLADNPVTMGEFVELSYSSLGKPHTIAMRGALRDQVDKEKITKVCKQITESQADFFGGLPYSKYVWHFNVTPGMDGGGGLEHLSSTQISLAQGVGPRSIHVCAHEFFHLWNVKRIRSKVLGPFDYNVLPKTGALYWLEGTTDYYASLLMLRYGMMEEGGFFQHMVENVFSVRNNPARLEVSPYESSMRVGEANDGRGNSSGWRISYYNLGWLVGLVLDIELRARTDGRRSLDDVTLALWKMNKDNKPGFEEDEIRKQCVRFGGAGMGEFFDKVVMRPGELPIEEQLAKVGLKLAEEEEKYVDPGFQIAPVFQTSNARVSRVRQGTENGLQADDVLLEIDGVAVVGANLQETMQKANAAISRFKPRVEVTVKVRRAGEDKEFKVTPTEASRRRWKVSDDGTADPKKLSLRKGWYYAGKKLKPQAARSGR